ncbi:MAG: chemotaxis protein CheD [Polyangiaceae bacterium]|nr:chemotaxis protein CheD [Polyangiaceae bacterium]
MNSQRGSSQLLQPVSRLVVGIAEFRVSKDRTQSIITHALGSCLGITVFDEVAGVGGMLHVMMPDSKVALDRAEAFPATFVDTGLPLLFKSSYALGASKSRMVLKVAGGASFGDEAQDVFQIGKRNMVALRKMLWKNGVMIKAEDTGGHESRTLELELGTGRVTVRSGGELREL